MNMVSLKGLQQFKRNDLKRWLGGCFLFPWVGILLISFSSVTLSGFPSALTTPSQVTPSNDSQTDLTKEQSEKADQSLKSYDLPQFEKLYIKELLRQYLYPNPNKVPLKIGRDFRRSENFILDAMLTEEEWKDMNDRFDFEKDVLPEVKKHPETLEWLKDVVVTVNILDGGIGANYGREGFKKWLHDKGFAESPGLSSKANDLGFFKTLKIKKRTRVKSPLATNVERRSHIFCKQ